MYDTFISYRRKGGKEIAPRIYDYLNGCGFDVFLDLAEMSSGRFDDQLRARLENADNFILILSPGALDRCADEDDWVRIEIRTAIRLNKNIVVFQAEDFDYPESLPSDIENIKMYQAVYYHDSTVHLQLKHIANMLIKESDTTQLSSDPGHKSNKRIKFGGEYITEYEDIENQRVVIKKAPATLHQFMNKIWGVTAFSDDKQWKINARVYNKKQIAGTYYATGYLDDGFGTFFLEAKSPTMLEGFWSGYDSIAKKVTSGRYIFHKKLDSFSILNATEKHYNSIVNISADQLGEGYVSRDGLAQMIRDGARVIVAADKKSGKVLGFCLFSVVDYRGLLKESRGNHVNELRGESEIGYIKTIAVGRKYSGRGVGTELLKRAMQILRDEKVTSFFSTAWKHAGIINVASLLRSVGFNKNREIADFWFESSVSEGYECPHCGNPCHCSCVIYTRVED